MKHVAVAVLLFGAQARAQAPGMTPAIQPLDQPAAPRSDPPVEGSTITGQIMLGGLLGVGGIAIGAYAGVGVACGTHSCDEEDIVPALVLAYTGGSLGLAAGEYLVGNSADAEGSFGWTFGGAMLGGLVGMGGAAMIDKAFDHDHRDARDTLEVLSILGGWMSGGLVGYYETRHWKSAARHAVAPTLHADSRGMAFGLGGSF